MDRFDLWDGLLLAAAAYVAVTSLVRLMLARHRKVAQQLYDEAQAERAKQRAQRDGGESDQRAA